MKWVEIDPSDAKEERLTNRDGVVKAWRFEAKAQYRSGNNISDAPVEFEGVLVRQQHGDVLCIPNPANEECLKIGVKLGEWESVEKEILNSAVWSYCQVKYGEALKKVL
jgi:hypothetical protein